MDCRQCRETLDGLLIAEAEDGVRFAPRQAELSEHLEACPDCARQHALALRALAAITPAHVVRASSDLRSRIMTAISATPPPLSEVAVKRHSRVRIGRWMAVAAATALLLAVGLFLRRGPKEEDSAAVSAFSLLAQACAAEERLFAGDRVVHLTNTIIVKPVSDPTLAKIRWLPIFSLEPTGRPRFGQLTLAAEPGKGYTVDDQSWYDPRSGRFARVLRSQGRAIFANSYDGKQVCSLEVAAGGAVKIVRRPVGKAFNPPKSPAEFLGMGVGLQGRLAEKGSEGLVEDKGAVALEGGAKGRLVKLGFPAGGPKEAERACYLVTIREDDTIIEKMEFLVRDEPLLVVQRGAGGTAANPEDGWDLSGIIDSAGASRPQLRAGFLPDMVIPNVSLEHVLAKAEFKVYAFQKDPPWAGRREIADILDIVSPPHRMFAVTYRAKDGRHVVLMQSHSYNTMLGPLVKIGKLVYTSPGGVKVWSGPRDAWLAQILLQSARATIHDPPGKNPIGYLLETPAGTFPALAINGPLTGNELHGLIDSLVPLGKPADGKP